jgi:zinc transporter ZupT
MMTYVFLIGSVLIGILLVLLLKPNKQITQLLLAFSGAYLLSVTILHLLPEVYVDSENSTTIGICILLGIVLQSILESFSKGAEHGHIHHHAENKAFPTLLFVSLSVHALSEGLPIHHAGENLLWAIAVHKIPIAVVLTSFLLQAKFSKTTTIIFLSVFALMSPLGVLLSEQIEMLQDHILEITAVIIGVFLHISTIILFESNQNHKFNIRKFLAILAGILLTVFTL